MALCISTKCRRARTGTTLAYTVPMEYLALIILAVAFFIGPAIVGTAGFWWFWRHERARAPLRLADSTRETQRQARADHADDENLRAS